ncbi:hypothetical protein EVAR_40000_1 [Eumeta japonica]|uniref:Uncharacterized protein n=1 Tax=Eumeta variegata TaxID=151549 RepID=A0A4C1ZPE8_EUMVA|nr:hypothetical protein EVAR_40000_1 [Eumeta japonica]
MTSTLPNTHSTSSYERPFSTAVILVSRVISVAAEKIRCRNCCTFCIGFHKLLFKHPNNKNLKGLSLAIEEATEWGQAGRSSVLEKYCLSDPLLEYRNVLDIHHSGTT